jgi:hypothetical protein
VGSRCGVVGVGGVGLKPEGVRGELGMLVGLHWDKWDRERGLVGW